MCVLLIGNERKNTKGVHRLDPTVQNDSKHTNNRDPNKSPKIRRSHHVEYVQIDITVVPAKYSFTMQRAKQ